MSAIFCARRTLLFWPTPLLYPFIHGGLLVPPGVEGALFAQLGCGEELLPAFLLAHGGEGLDSCAGEGLFFIQGG